MRVVVLGATGMLGSMVVDVLSREPGMNVAATGLEPDLLEQMSARKPGLETHLYNAETDPADKLADLLAGATWAINAIGIVKTHINDSNAGQVRRAVRVNALFPYELAAAAERAGCRVIQIATDCVYSGGRGHYVERDPHDPLDVYGKTKSLGEVVSANVLHLRCSIIGPELMSHRSLLDWFLYQPAGATVSGYTTHHWNGVTTLHFARLCLGAMRSWTGGGIRHVVPGNGVTKHDLLHCVKREFGREDIEIMRVDAQTAVDRTIGTLDEQGNRGLWAAAGYDQPPTIEQMVSELARFRPVWQG